MFLLSHAFLLWGPQRAQGPSRAQGKVPAGPRAPSGHLQGPREGPPGPRGGPTRAQGWAHQGPGPGARAKRAPDSSIYMYIYIFIYGTFSFPRSTGTRMNPLHRPQRSIFRYLPFHVQLFISTDLYPPMSMPMGGAQTCSGFMSLSLAWWTVGGQAGRWVAGRRPLPAAMAYARAHAHPYALVHAPRSPSVRQRPERAYVCVGHSGTLRNVHANRASGRSPGGTLLQGQHSSAAPARETPRAI